MSFCKWPETRLYVVRCSLCFVFFLIKNVGVCLLYGCLYTFPVGFVIHVGLNIIVAMCHVLRRQLLTCRL